MPLSPLQLHPLSIFTLEGRELRRLTVWTQLHRVAGMVAEAVLTTTTAKFQMAQVAAVLLTSEHQQITALA